MPQKIERMNESFDGLDPEYNTMVLFQKHINQLVDALNLLGQEKGEEKNNKEMAETDRFEILSDLLNSISN